MPSVAPGLLAGCHLAPGASGYCWHPNAATFPVPVPALRGLAMMFAAPPHPTKAHSPQMQTLKRRKDGATGLGRAGSQDEAVVAGARRPAGTEAASGFRAVPSRVVVLSVGARQVDGVPSLAELVSREGPMFKIVVEGQAFGKLMENGTLKSEYVLRLEPSCHVLQAGKKQLVDVCRLKEVRIGFLTQTFLLHAEKHGLLEECCFSLVYEREGGQLPQILNLVAPSNERRDMWAHAFRLLIQTLSAMNAECYSLMAPWIGALKKGGDCLGIKETVALLDSLHISADNVKEQQKGFTFFFPDFIRLVRRLRSHPVITYVFASHAHKDNDALWSAEQLIAFCAQEQGETMTAAEAETIVARYGNGTFDEFALQKYLISRDNSVWKPAKEAHSHPMTRKLTEYFVNSSHNTYLSGSQLNSVSSIEMYIRALKLGCRCLEIDIWDGPSGEPIVYHGFTLTTKIMFRDVLRVIRSHGFVATPYPLILSFENHCSKAQQDKMAQYLKEILGDMVLRYMGGRKSESLPSPEQLKYRVLIKGSNHVSSSLELIEDLEDDVDLALGGTLTKEEVSFLQEKIQSKRAAEHAGGDKENEKLSTELNDLIYLRAKKLAKFPHGYEAFEPNFMTSFSENRINRILQDHNGFQHLRKFNAHYVSRVYPKGTRFDSSNYDPILYWYAGVQMLALNFQSSTDAPMLINWAKFRENGSVGYNLRPDYLNLIVPASGSVQFGSLFAKVERFSRPEPICNRLRVHVYGGRQYVTRRATWVELALYDGTSRADRYKTPPCNNNFSPDYDFECVIPVTDSANAYLTMVVSSKEEGSFGFFCIPLECIREGYRAVHLMDSLYEPIAKGMCHLLCKFTLEKDAKLAS
jgi:phosphatidylinositol phospholipase C delta